MMVPYPQINQYDTSNLQIKNKYHTGISVDAEKELVTKFNIHLW